MDVWRCVYMVGNAPTSVNASLARQAASGEWTCGASKRNKSGLGWAE